MCVCAEILLSLEKFYNNLRDITCAAADFIESDESMLLRGLFIRDYFYFNALFI